MTARTSELLAQALDQVGLANMARRAREDYYHDYFSPLAMPSITLASDLAAAIETCQDPVQRIMIVDIRNDHLEGKFDADMAESDEWAASPEGLDTFGRLLKDARNRK